MKIQPQVDLSAFQNEESNFAHLSLHDLVTARDLFHVHLMRHPDVVATAVGRYRIRVGDSWPNDKKKIHGTSVRRLDNSEVRPYSWPCILVFVTEWQDPKESKPDQLVPSTIFMPDGKRVPICVIEAPKESKTAIEARNIRFPLNNIGPGNPIIAEVQGQEYVATVGCLVSDGHKIFALTNRHVTGNAGEVVWCELNGVRERVGTSAEKQLTRLPFSSIYPNFAVQNTYVNLDIGLIEVDDIARWTPKVPGIGILGPMADFSGINLSLSLVGCHVRGVGAATGEMLGEIQGLFYRYKTSGGFEYVSDLFIGPRSPANSAGRKPVPPPKFATHPGDSGTLWVLEPTVDSSHAKAGDNSAYLPLAMQWGVNMLDSAGSARPQGFALATLLSRVCALLEVDPVRDWNVDQSDTWGALGHFSIAARTLVALSGNYPHLDTLMGNNRKIITHDDDILAGGDFKGMGTADFVPMADVPDFFWKPGVGKQHHTRPWEGPNHFADMDQKDARGNTLLSLTTSTNFIDPDKWQNFYDSVKDILGGQPIEPKHRGLLPFRVWQIFDSMCQLAADGDAQKFVCAAGVLTHYVGDACQPLHISYLHDGDPNRPIEHEFTKGKKAGTTEKRPLGQGVHSAYEDAMVFDHRMEILDGLKRTTKVKKSELIANGFEAAQKTIDMMRNVFAQIPPLDMVQTYVDVGKGGKASSDALWAAYGQKTINVMKQGSHLLAVLWESAWEVGGGETKVKSLRALTQDEAMGIVSDPDFLPSMTVDQIGASLKKPRPPAASIAMQTRARG
jgi:hypothetical protein